VYEQMIKKYEEENKPLPENLLPSVTSEVAAANPDVQAIIAPRIKMLMEIANSFLQTIMDSIEQTPYGIRWICKQIRSLTKIAKVLQNLVNKPTYLKEEYMIMLNPFVESNKQRLNKFLMELCEMDQYMALSKKDLVINITLNEIYNTHALLVQHQEELAASEKSHLRMLLEEVGPAPPQVSRKENKTVELPLFSRWETPIQDLATALLYDNSVTQNDILYMETKSIFVQIIRSTPKMTEQRSINLHQIAETAATSKDATLVRKGIKVKDMLRELEDASVIDPKDGYRLMTEEVTQELAHLGNLREKVTNEIQSLESVYKTICDHNNYLRSQLDSYKAYLQNVRQQTVKDSAGGFGSSIIKVGDKEKKPTKQKALGPYKFTHTQLERDGIIVESNVPENRRQNIFFVITSPIPGTFIIALHYKGRDAAILEMDLKLDDLLEKVTFSTLTIDDGN
ncbi:12952_t:CDS:2, partial [Cetraspora pellucida]